MPPEVFAKVSFGFFFFSLSVLHPLETIYRPISILSHAALSGIGMETLLASPK